MKKKCQYPHKITGQSGKSRVGLPPIIRQGCKVVPEGRKKNRIRKSMATSLLSKQMNSPGKVKALGGKISTITGRLLIVPPAFRNILKRENKRRRAGRNTALCGQIKSIVNRKEKFKIGKKCRNTRKVSASFTPGHRRSLKVYVIVVRRSHARITDG